MKPKSLGGRPLTNGVSPGWMLLRATIVIQAFNQARQSGEKYEASLELAVEAVKAKFPQMKISISEVKKILKEFMPENGEECLRVTESKSATNDDPKKPASPTTLYEVGFAPRPDYPLPSQRKSSKTKE